MEKDRHRLKYIKLENKKNRYNKKRSNNDTNDPNLSTNDHRKLNTSMEKKRAKNNNSSIDLMNNNESLVFIEGLKVNENKKRNDNKAITSYEDIMKLKKETQKIFNPAFEKKIFDDDLKNLIDAFYLMKQELDTRAFIELYLDNLNIILKILGYKLINNMNVTLLSFFFDFMDSIYTIIIEKRYKLSDFESNIIIYLLLDKITINNNQLKKHLLSLMNKFINLIDPNKIVPSILVVSLAKNKKTKDCVLDFVLDLFIKGKLNPKNKNIIKTLPKFLNIDETNDNNSDNTINEIQHKALKIFKVIYRSIGDELWNMKEIPPKEMEFLKNNLDKMEDINNNNTLDIESQAKAELQKQEKLMSKINAISAKLKNIKEYENRVGKPMGISNLGNKSKKNPNKANSNSLPNEELEQKANTYKSSEIKKPNNNSSLRTGKKEPGNVKNANNTINESETKENTINTQNNTINANNNEISSEEDLLKIFQNLFSQNEYERINAIITIHEITCTNYLQNKLILIPNIDAIIRIFIQITHKMFIEDDIKNLPITFAKPLVTIICKMTSNKELIMHLSYKVLYDLINELLNYLLIKGLDKIGDNQEGGIIFKSLNSAMLRIIDNCDMTSVIIALFELIKENQTKTDDQSLSNLSLKCLIKATQNIANVVQNSQVDKILLEIHLLLIGFDNLDSGGSQTDIMTVRFIKNLIVDITKYKKEAIIDDYKKSIAVHQYKDKYILNWIQNILNYQSAMIPKAEEKTEEEDNTNKAKKSEVTCVNRTKNVKSGKNLKVYGNNLENEGEKNRPKQNKAASTLNNNNKISMNGGKIKFNFTNNIAQYKGDNKNKNK